MSVLEAYRSFYEPCCFPGDHKALVNEEEILSDLTICSTNSAANTTSSESNAMKKAMIIHNTKSVGRRRARADTVRSVFANPNELRACNNMQVECIGLAGHADLTDEPMPLRVRRTDMWKEYMESAKPNNVVVAIEATHICPLDVCIRQGIFSNQLETPFVLGSNFVGIVHHGALPKGTRVAALTKTGSNARYISASPDDLVKVPKRFDSSEVACIISSYLPAFQALHHGRSQIRKHSKDSLKGKKILLTEGVSMLETQAMVQLAFTAGAASVYVICQPHFHNYVRMYLNAKPLGVKFKDWFSVVEGRMDIIIDYDYSYNRTDIADALAPEGRLVWFAHPPTKHSGNFADFHNVMDMASICSLTRGSIYDVYENWEFYREESKEDLKFLFGLLTSRKIRPKIDRYINLNGIRNAHEELLNGGIFGAIICEPWKEEGR
jgi:NADPH2:quinone reductase